MKIRGSAHAWLWTLTWRTWRFPSFLSIDIFLVLLCLSTEVESGSLTRLGSARLLPGNLRNLQSAVPSSLNPEGIYVWATTATDLHWPRVSAEPGESEEQRRRWTLYCRCETDHVLVRILTRTWWEKEKEKENTSRQKHFHWLWRRWMNWIFSL